ncbi:MAG: hypothetical protein RML10_09745 [Geminocystis sp.]|nr:hypothetical protein [Geminocystis sp.]
METVESRLDRLERIVERMAVENEKARREFMEEMRKRDEEFRNEMRERSERFEQEMRERSERFEREMRERSERFEQEMRERSERFEQEMRERNERFEQEMRERHEDFRQEMKKMVEEHRKEMKEEIKRKNKEWGDLANKMGTIVEDIIYPALRPVLKKYFGCKAMKYMIRVVYRAGETEEEFDAIAECNGMVFLVEVKETPRQKHVEEIKQKAKRFLSYFPEYSNKELVLIMASLRFSDNFVKYLSKNRIYAMAFREWEYMDILNFEEVKGYDKELSK